MDKKTAEIISKKAKALKHCDKVLDAIDRFGSTRINLNCTGVAFDVKRGDAIYLAIQAKKYELLAEIGSFRIVESHLSMPRTATSPTLTESPTEKPKRKYTKRTVKAQPARDSVANPSNTDKDAEQEKIEKRRAYHRERYAKRKAAANLEK